MMRAVPSGQEPDAGGNQQGGRHSPRHPASAQQWCSQVALRLAQGLLLDAGLPLPESCLPGAGEGTSGSPSGVGPLLPLLPGLKRSSRKSCSTPGPGHPTLVCHGAPALQCPSAMRGNLGQPGVRLGRKQGGAAGPLGSPQSSVSQLQTCGSRQESLARRLGKLTS